MSLVELAHHRPADAGMDPTAWCPGLYEPIHMLWAGETWLD